jgi:hypothetical protein
MALSLLDTLNSISTSLAVLGQQVRAEALAGLGSRNKVAEHVLLPVLRSVYHAPGLANANTVAANFPGVDLYDPSSGLGVQVTSEVTPDKITQTIAMVVKERLPITRLVIALAVDTAPTYSAKTRTKWRALTNGHFTFDPAADVLAFDRLLARIQLLPMAEITAIAAELQTLVYGTHQIHLLPHLQAQVRAQLAEEQRIARYIPKVFVETQDSKYQARCFAHPVLFIRRIAAWFDRQPFASLNRLATMSGVPTIRTPLTDSLVSANTLEQARAAAQAFIPGLKDLDEILTLYSEIDKPEGAAIPRDTKYKHVLDETRYNIKRGAEGMQYRVRDRCTELQCVTARVFLLIGPAGQGKTNFVCDFTERFLLRHNIPCAYLTVRQLSRISQSDLRDAVCQLIFPSAITTLEEGLTTLSTVCAERNQPFVLVIDGLNEHPNVRTFAGQLEYFLETLIPYPYVRILMTCRSEFLEQRFGSLLSGSLAPVLYVSGAHGQRFDEEQHCELVARYFRFFKVRPRRVIPYAIDFLRQDVLLLRFFCEAYGARGRQKQYTQPAVAGIYRDDIFRRYVEEKLGRAEHFISNDQSVARSLVHQNGLRRLISLVAAHMIQTRQYANVPRTVVPVALDVELAALLDEELVLRQDLGPPPSLLAEPNEVLNFTFDELRDFLLAQHLLSIYAQNPDEFVRLLALQQPIDTQSIEGLQRFLFYASRVPTNRTFFESYRTHVWYGAVYDTEVFAIPPTHLDAEDRQIIEAALNAGGARARHFARELAVRWDPSVFPTLNLEVLLAVARQSDEPFFSDVFVPTFDYAPYGEDTLGSQFCHLVESRVLPKFTHHQDHPYDSVFRLLLLLLPIDANGTLDSPAVTVFRQFIANHPPYALGLLQHAIDDGIRWHRAFIWRLLSMSVSTMHNVTFFIAAAQMDVANDPDPVIRREAERFLSCLAAAEHAS